METYVKLKDVLGILDENKDAKAVWCENKVCELPCVNVPESSSDDEWHTGDPDICGVNVVALVKFTENFATSFSYEFVRYNGMGEWSTCGVVLKWKRLPNISELINV